MQRALLSTVALGIFSTQLLFAADWPAFRGPQLNGVALDKSAPTEWSSDENIRWKAPLPQPGNGSPIVSNGRVFVTSAEDAEGKQRSLYCFDETNGKQLWVKTVDFGRRMPTHKTNPYGGSTPVADGERVVVWHASAGLYCYGFDGKELWSRDLGEFKHMWGYGSSPIFYKGKVILHTGPGERVFVTAIDPDSGKTVWQVGEPLDGNGERNDAGEYMGSWCTPVIAQVDGRNQIIVAHPTRLVAYNPDDGKVIWFSDGIRHNKGDLAYSSPVISGDICFYTGGFGGPAFAVRLGGGAGDVTASHRLWRNERQPQSIGTGVAVDGKVYRPNANGAGLQCIDPTNGKILWQERDAGGQWASLVMAGGLLYATSQDTQTTIFKPNPQAYEEVASNRLPGSCNATPAIANGRILIRASEHLWCIGE